MLSVAGVWPELVRWVVNIDGLGPPPQAFEERDLAESAAEYRAITKDLGEEDGREYDGELMLVLANDAARRMLRLGPSTATTAPAEVMSLVRRAVSGQEQLDAGPGQQVQDDNECRAGEQGARDGARRGRWATPATRSATSWACRPPRNWPPAGPWTGSGSPRIRSSYIAVTNAVKCSGDWSATIAVALTARVEYELPVIEQRLNTPGGVTVVVYPADQYGCGHHRLP